MKKSSYLKDPEVKNFIEWLSQNLCNDTFAHSYVNRRNGKPWSCSSLFDAYKQYEWPTTPTALIQSHSNVKAGSDFSTNANVLAVLKSLLDSTKASDLTGFTDAAVDVMTWGGVRAGNVSWLQNSANQKVLLHSIQSTQAALNAGDTTDPVLNNKSLRFNAGMTKVYSLICDDFIIYDSRVGAAIGWIVSKYCQIKGMTSVPAELCFPWAPAKEAQSQPNPKQRDPSSATLKFARLKSGPLHAQWNMKASWLLKEVLQHSTTATNNCFKEVPGHLQLRALEAGLFMIGYDLGGGESPPKSDPKDLSVTQNWIECFTRSKQMAFQYQLHDDRITTQSLTNDGGWKVGPTFSAELIDATLAELHKSFSPDEDFPLANSATAVQIGEAEPGLGTAYFQASHRKGNPPDTSKLAAILDEMGILIPVVKDKRYSKRWTIAKGVLTVKELLKQHMENDDNF